MATYNILLIDDSEDDRFFLCYLMNRVSQNVKIIEYSYADEALAFLRSPDRPRIDALFVDINMPRVDGFEFVDRYHELYPELKGDALVYVLSGSINPADKRRSEQHEAVTGYLQKPLVQQDAESVLEALQSA